MISGENSLRLIESKKDERTLRAFRYIALFPRGYIITKENRRKIVEATIRSFDREAKSILVSDIKVKRVGLDQNITKEVEKEVKGLPDLVTQEIARFLVQKLLNWLWNESFSQAMKQSYLKQEGGKDGTTI